MRPARFLAGAAFLFAAFASLNAQDAGPIVLLLPVSARNAALGNAAVAGRDEYSAFANPARLNATNGFGLTVGTYGHDTRVGAVMSAATMGPITLGWGLHLVRYVSERSGAGAQYPYVPADLTGNGRAESSSMLALVAGQMLYKGFRIGVAAKYAEELAPRETSTIPHVPLPDRGTAFLADIGATHPLWTGLAGISLQNLGQTYSIHNTNVNVPTQLALGWSAQYAWGAFDYGFATQVAARRGGWISPAAGVEMGWSWIEGMSVTARVGAHRPETVAERPVGAGFTIGADRLLLDYGATFFSGASLGHRLTVRWR